MFQTLCETPEKTYIYLKFLMILFLEIFVNSSYKDDEKETLNHFAATVSDNYSSIKIYYFHIYIYIEYTYIGNFKKLVFFVR